MNPDEVKQNQSLLKTLAQESPRKLPPLLKTLYQKENMSRLNSLMPSVLCSLIQNQPVPTIERVAPKVLRILSDYSGAQTAYNLISRMEVMFQLRKPTIGLYDHTLHTIGGGQKYGCTLAWTLQKNFDITLIANKTISLEELHTWYHLDLSHCKTKVMELPFFQKKGFHEIDPEIITSRTENPFHLISRESGQYDIFINNSMLEKVYPLSPVSVLICHFPERRRSHYFYANQYTYTIYNSHYTAEWIQKKWKIRPTTHIYPPVDVPSSEPNRQKENIILSAARFEKGGSKQQLEMVEVFGELSRTYPETFENWRLVLAGGSVNNNPYLEKIKHLLRWKEIKNVDIKINIPLNELKSLFQKAKIFWHLCGLKQTDPARVEHFGMSIVEAMQNHCVPVVFDGGGQREIVEQGVSGFRFSSKKELKNMTLKIMTDNTLWNTLSRGASTRGAVFSREAFVAKVIDFFKEIMDKHFTIEQPVFRE